MKRFRHGKYCMYQDYCFDLIRKENNRFVLVARTEYYNESLKKMGFHKYADGVYVLEVNSAVIQSAFYVRIWANYDGYSCDLCGVDYENSDDPILYLYAPEEYQIKTGDHPMHGYDPKFRVKLSALDDIWEERTPIEGFKFDVEPIVYLKKDGVWLVEH